MSWQCIESDQALAGLLAEHADNRVVAVDTEFMRRDTFYPRVALVQLCFGDDIAWLVDPLAIDDPAPLRELLARHDITKVLHSASEDLEVFDHWLGVLPEPLFDTQRAAALLGHEFGLGYRALVQTLCGVELPKGETRSDWLQRPLTQAQCDYAAQDVTWLLEVWRVLEAEAREQGRLEWVLQEGRDTLESFRATQGHPIQRIKSAWKLDRRQLAALMRLCEWREAEARHRDKPRGWILDDAACLALALRRPRTPEDLQTVDDLKPSTVKRYAEDLLAELAEIETISGDALPDRLPAPLDAEERRLLKTLRQRGQSLAGRLGVAPAALLSGKDYELLLREAAGESVQVPGHWGGWRASRAIEPLRASLREPSS